MCPKHCPWKQCYAALNRPTSNTSPLRTAQNVNRVLSSCPHIVGVRLASPHRSFGGSLLLELTVDLFAVRSIYLQLALSTCSRRRLRLACVNDVFWKLQQSTNDVNYRSTRHGCHQLMT